VWSPAGSEIAFQDNDHPGWGIGLMKIDGTGVRDVLTIARADSTYGDPTWSPDGAQLAFSYGTFNLGAGVDGATDLYVMNRDGSGLRRLTTTGDVHHPTWGRASLGVRTAAMVRQMRRLGGIR
jgi:TolB protein